MSKNLLRRGSSNSPLPLATPIACCPPFEFEYCIGCWPVLLSIGIVGVPVRWVPLIGEIGLMPACDGTA